MTHPSVDIHGQTWASARLRRDPITQEGTPLATASASSKKLRPLGDRVLYAKYAGTEFKVDDDELLILSQKDILAIVEA